MSKRPAESSFRKALGLTYKTARRIVIAVVGTSVVLIGVAMLVLPGPAFVVIPAGLAILGVEFAFARRWLRSVKARAQQGLDTLGLGNQPAASTAEPQPRPTPERRPTPGPHSAASRPAEQASPSGHQEKARVTNQ